MHSIESRHGTPSAPHHLHAWNLADRRYVHSPVAIDILREASSGLASAVMAVARKLDFVASDVTVCIERGRHAAEGPNACRSSCLLVECSRTREVSWRASYEANSKPSSPAFALYSHRWQSKRQPHCWQCERRPSSPATPLGHPSSWRLQANHMCGEWWGVRPTWWKYELQRW